MDSVRTLFTVWLALLALLALSVASAWVDLGVGNVLANVGIASIKATLIAWFFMHLGRDRALLRLTALLGLVWLLFLIGLSLADRLTRPKMESPDPALVTIASPAASDHRALEPALRANGKISQQSGLT